MARKRVVLDFTGSVQPQKCRRVVRAHSLLCVTIIDTIRSRSELWAAATRHPFLDDVREGRVSTAAFDTWLAQDVLFVSDLLWFQERLLARAPRSAQPVLAAGTLGLTDELGWFEERAGERGLRLDVPPLPATRGYSALLRSLDGAPYEVAVAGLWVLERVYLEAWTYASSPAGPYQVFVAHWTTPEFAGYVAALEKLVADEPAQARTADILAMCDEVLSQERAFWDAALES